MSPESGNLPIVDASLIGGNAILYIDSLSPLVNIEAAATVQFPGGMVLVARATETTFIAVSAICTHQACTIDTYRNQMYTCPCHGAQFDILGEVKKGPAASPLRQYPTQFDGSQLTIFLS